MSFFLRPDKKRQKQEQTHPHFLLLPSFSGRHLGHERVHVVLLLVLRVIPELLERDEGGLHPFPATRGSGRGGGRSGGGVARSPRCLPAPPPRRRFPVPSQRVQQPPRVHRGQGHVVCVHHRGGDVQLEPLQAQHPLLQGPPDQEPVDRDGPRLAQPVRAVHRLHVLHRVPVVLEEDDGVRRGQVEAQASDVRRQEQDGDRGVGLEGRRDAETLGGRDAAVEAQEGDAGRPEHAGLDEVERGAELGEDEDAVAALGGGAAGLSLAASCSPVVVVVSAGDDAAVDQQLPERRELGRVRRGMRRERRSQSFDRSRSRGAALAPQAKRAGERRGGARVPLEGVEDQRRRGAELAQVEERAEGRGGSGDRRGS